MAEIPVVELQLVVAAVAILAGILRGGIGYWFGTPDDEPFSGKKFSKTVVRYAIFNLVSVNILAYAGILWTPVTVAIYTATQIASELGFDINEAMRKPT